MFWSTNADRLQKALIRFRNKYALGDEADAVLDDLINWLGDQYGRRLEWLHDAWIRFLMGSDQFDKESLAVDIKCGLQALQAFSITLAGKLAALHRTLSVEQRQQIAEEFKAYEQVQRQWYGWDHRRQLRLQAVA